MKMKNIYSKVLCGILISASLQSCDDYLDVFFIDISYELIKDKYI